MKKIRLHKKIKIAFLAAYDVVVFAASAVLAVLLTKVGIEGYLTDYLAVAAANLAVYAI